ncbi:MAG: hypothetical protein LUE23_01440, partial [Lachnospiraceae bacterium]|nr:hypothetical protein [Lachnospiraceae bacterium]
NLNHDQLMICSGCLALLTYSNALEGRNTIITLTPILLFALRHRLRRLDQNGLEGLRLHDRRRIYPDCYCQCDRVRAVLRPTLF